MDERPVVVGVHAPTLGAELTGTWPGSEPPRSGTRAAGLGVGQLDAAAAEPGDEPADAPAAAGVFAAAAVAGVLDESLDDGLADEPTDDGLDDGADEELVDFDFGLARESFR